MATQRQRLLKIFESNPILKSQEITITGIDPTTVQRMVESGEVLKTGRSLYTLSEYDPDTHFSLVQAQRRVTSGVICLLSALSFHGIGTQIPRRVWMAIPRSSRVPHISEFPVRIVKFSGAAFTGGISTHDIDGVSISVYDAPKTVVTASSIAISWESMWQSRHFGMSYVTDLQLLMNSCTMRWCAVSQML